MTTISRSKRGFVYIVTHPRFPGQLKIGCARRPRRRLATFNTACPYREFTLVHQFATSDQYQLEAEAHSRLSLWRGNGEWFEMPVGQAAAVIHEIRQELQL